MKEFTGGFSTAVQIVRNFSDNATWSRLQRTRDKSSSRAVPDTGITMTLLVYMHNPFERCSDATAFYGLWPRAFGRMSVSGQFWWGSSTKQLCLRWSWHRELMLAMVLNIGQLCQMMLLGSTPCWLFDKKGRVQVLFCYDAYISQLFEYTKLFKLIKLLL